MTTRNLDLVQRLQSAERWLAADLAIRALGGAALALCAIAVWGLFRSVHRPPAHAATLGELADGLAAVVSWACGGALLCEGKGLFRQVAVPVRYTCFTPKRIQS